MPNPFLLLYMAVVYLLTRSCWLASGGDKHAIWTFVGPMLAIIAVSHINYIPYCNVNTTQLCLFGLSVTERLYLCTFNFLCNFNIYKLYTYNPHVLRSTQCSWYLCCIAFTSARQVRIQGKTNLSADMLLPCEYRIRHFSNLIILVLIHYI